MLRVCFHSIFLSVQRVAGRKFTRCVRLELIERQGCRAGEAASAVERNRPTLAYLSSKVKEVHVGQTSKWPRQEEQTTSGCVIFSSNVRHFRVRERKEKRRKHEKHAIHAFSGTIYKSLGSVLKCENRLVASYTIPWTASLLIHSGECSIADCSVFRFFYCQYSHFGYGQFGADCMAILTKSSLCQCLIYMFLT